VNCCALRFVDKIVASRARPSCHQNSPQHNALRQRRVTGQPTGGCRDRRCDEVVCAIRSHRRSTRSSLDLPDPDTPVLGRLYSHLGSMRWCRRAGSRRADGGAFRQPVLDPQLRSGARFPPSPPPVTRGQRRRTTCMVPTLGVRLGLCAGETGRQGAATGSAAARTRPPLRFSQPVVCFDAGRDSVRSGRATSPAWSRQTLETTRASSKTCATATTSPRRALPIPHRTGRHWCTRFARRRCPPARRPNLNTLPPLRSTSHRHADRRLKLGLGRLVSRSRRPCSAVRTATPDRWARRSPRSCHPRSLTSSAPRLQDGGEHVVFAQAVLFQRHHALRENR